MGRLSLAWRILTNGRLAERVEEALRRPEQPAIPLAKKPAKEPAKQPAAAATSDQPLRSDAVTLLATLQREARLIDFLKESLDSYTDAQIGASVRDIHRDCAAVLERQFDVQPVLTQAEGSRVSIAAGTSTLRIKRLGRNAEQSGTGTLVHPGWMIGRSELPVWTGDAESAAILSPAEVEID